MYQRLCFVSFIKLLFCFVYNDKFLKTQYKGNFLIEYYHHTTRSLTLITYSSLKTSKNLSYLHIFTLKTTAVKMWWLQMQFTHFSCNVTVRLSITNQLIINFSGYTLAKPVVVTIFCIYYKKIIKFQIALGSVTR